MVLHVYIKENNSPKRQVINHFSYLLLVIGSLLLFWSFYPVISFEIYSKLFLQEKIYSPVPIKQMVSSLELANNILGSSIGLSSNLRDFTQADLWFPTQSTSSSKFSNNLQSKEDYGGFTTTKEYFLSIPKINIKQAKVIVGGNDLKNSLIQYLPKSLPGRLGNVAIFGHSTLPQFYNPKDYKTIFTFLPSLERGDKIYTKLGDTEYEYEIYEMFVVDPDQISVLEQKLDVAYLTLITCVPPGTYWKRLVVRAKLNVLPLN